MRYTLLLCASLLLVFHAAAAEADSPHWSFSLRAGDFIPEIDGWKDRYEHDGDLTGGVEIGWKILRPIELTAGAHYFYDEGKAVTVTGRKSDDRARFEQIPFNISLLIRFVFNENQIIVPYAGGGYTYTLYWQKLGKRNSSGDREGYHWKGGLQFLLDAIDPEAARELYRGWGISNTYFLFEGVYSVVDDFGKEDFDLGGWGILGGFLFEF